jgi:hypothetical protein
MRGRMSRRLARASSGGGDGESGGGSTLAESGAAVFGIAVLSLATLSGAIGVSRRSAVPASVRTSSLIWCKHMLFAMM